MRYETYIFIILDLIKRIDHKIENVAHFGMLLSNFLLYPFYRAMIETALEHYVLYVKMNCQVGSCLVKNFSFHVFIKLT